MRNESVLEPIIKEMLTAQGKLNRIAIGEEWPTMPECNFHLAIQQEAAEGVDHLAWKWWTPQQENIPRAQMEVVDIMHFVLSAELRDYLNSDGPGPEEFMEALVQDYYKRDLSITVDATLFNPNSMEPVELFSLLSTMAGVKHTSFGLTCLLGESLGLTFLQLSKLYRAKATLNIFRQAHGYKTGKYHKIWIKPPNGNTAGYEDNDVMQDALGEFDWTSGKATDELYKRLEGMYEKVLASLYA